MQKMENVLRRGRDLTGKHDGLPKEVGRGRTKDKIKKKCKIMGNLSNDAEKSWTKLLAENGKYY